MTTYTVAFTARVHEAELHRPVAVAVHERERRAPPVRAAVVRARNRDAAAGRRGGDPPVRTIEHGCFLDEEGIALMRQRRATLVPTTHFMVCSVEDWMGTGTV